MRYVAALGIPLLALLSFTLVTAWTGPTASPPNGNVAPPINVGTAQQVKNGTIGVNGLVVFGNSLLGGFADSDAYLNFGATTGSSGYGIRDNNGLLEFKNSSSTWQSLQSVLWNLCGGPCGGTSNWTASGNNIYNTNSGNVGIGTANPAEKLDLGGGNIKMGYEQVSGAGGLVSPKTIGGDLARCSAGKKVIGGGCLSNWYMTHITQSYPSSDSTWYCAAYNTDSSAASTIYAYAICANMK